MPISDPPPDDDSTAAMLTVNQVCERLSLASYTVRRLIESGELKAIYINVKRSSMRPMFRVYLESLEEFERSRSTPPRPEAAHRPRPPVEKPAACPPPLVPLLTLQDVGRRLAVSAETVRQFIHTGQMRAIDVSVDRASKRPNLRVRREDLETFEFRRTIDKEPPPPQPRRRLKHVKRYV